MKDPGSGEFCYLMRLFCILFCLACRNSEGRFAASGQHISPSLHRVAWKLAPFAEGPWKLVGLGNVWLVTFVSIEAKWNTTILFGGGILSKCDDVCSF